MSVTTGSDLVAQLREVLGREPGVVVAYLFGSRATGQHRVESDVDVAVLTRDRDVVSRLAPDLAAAVAPLRVDLVDLADAPVALAYRVIRNGQLLLSTDEPARRRHWVRTVDRHLDMAPARRMLAEGTRRRVLEGRFGRL